MSAPGGLNLKTGPFRPRHRVRHRQEFVAVYESTRPWHGKRLVIYLMPRSGEAESRLGLAVSRKVGNAPVRNRVKRKLRALFRAKRGELATPCDVIIHVRPGRGGEASSSTLEDEMTRAFAAGPKPRA